MALHDENSASLHGQTTSGLRSPFTFAGSASPDVLIQQRIGCADHDTLVRCNNMAYLGVVARLQCVQQERDVLQIRLDEQILLYDRLLNRVSGAPVSTPFLLGSHMTLPTGANISVCGKVKYWNSASWTRTEQGAPGRPGPHLDDENIAQRYIEDANGNPVSGAVAAAARATTNALLLSLAQNDQVAPSASRLTYEALCYLHSNLAKQFPMLLFCDGGMWKTTVLIGQIYSGFMKTHRARVAASAKVKSEEQKVEDFDIPLSQESSSKRTKHTRTESVDIRPAPKKQKATTPQPHTPATPDPALPATIIPSISITPGTPHHQPTQLQPSPPSSTISSLSCPIVGPDVQASSKNGDDYTIATPLEDQESQNGPVRTITDDLEASEQDPSAGSPDDNTIVPQVPGPMSWPSHSASSPSDLSPPETEAAVQSTPAPLDISGSAVETSPGPSASMSPMRTMDTAALDLLSDAAAYTSSSTKLQPSSEGSLIVLPESSYTRKPGSFPNPVRRLTRSSNTDDDQEHAGAATELSQCAVPPDLPSKVVKGRARKAAGSDALLSTKYKAGTISWQSLLMRDMISVDASVTYKEYQTKSASIATDDVEYLKRLKTEAADMKKAKKTG